MSIAFLLAAHLEQLLPRYRRPGQLLRDDAVGARRTRHLTATAIAATVGQGKGGDSDIQGVIGGVLERAIERGGCSSTNNQ